MNKKTDQLSAHFENEVSPSVPKGLLSALSESHSAGPYLIIKVKEGVELTGSWQLQVSKLIT